MLYFDEAGNSGENLLDSNQPCYLLLSHDFTEEETLEILNPLLSISKAQELHFKNLRRYSSRRKLLIDCLNNKLVNKTRIHYYVAHKEFMIVIQMVDKLIEPQLYHNGIDIYVEGLNLSTANVLYIMGTRVWDKSLFKKICRLFIIWVRSSLTKDCISFYKCVKELFDTLTSEEDKELLGLILYSKKYYEQILETFEKYSLDATLSCFIEHCNHWAKIHKHGFDITFDNSKQIEHWRGMINFFAKELPEAEVGFGSRKHNYPLRIKNIFTQDSKTSKQLQLADLLASSSNYIFINKINEANDKFSNEIMNCNLGLIEGNQMWPSAAITPEQLNMLDTTGQNPLDFIAKIALQKPEAFERASPKN